MKKLRRLMSWLGKNNPKALRSLKADRLGMERLEDRLVPTAYTWTGAAGTFAWGTAGNWSDVPAGGTFPSVSGDTATFNNAVPAGGWTITLPTTAVSLTTLTLNNTGNPITLATGGSTFTLTGTTPSIADISAVADTISTPIALGTAATVSDTSTGALTLSGAISGAFALTKSGSGTAIFSGTNTYTGATTVSAGTLQIGAGGTTGSLGTGGAVSVPTGSTLAFERSDLALSVANVISGAGTLQFIGTNANQASGYALTGVNTFSGTINTSSVTVGGNGVRLQVSTTGALGTATVNVSSGSQLYVFGSTFSNTINIAGIGWSEQAGNLGALRVEGGIVSGSVVLTANATISNLYTTTTGTISGTISGAYMLTDKGPGPIVLTGVNTYTGGTAITSGTLQLGNGSVNGTINSTSYAISAPAKLFVLDASTPSTFPWSSFSGAGTLEISSAAVGNWPTLALSSALTGTLAVDNSRIQASPAQLGGVTNVVINSGAQILAWDGGTGAAPLTYTQAFSIAGLGSETGYNYGAIRSASNDIFSGNITLTNNSGFYEQNYGSSRITVSGVISGAYTVSIYGIGAASPITLSGANT